MSYKLEYDHKSFMLNGKREFLHAASIHYFRFPQEEWREVLWKAKLAGVNCIDTYFAWNVHEPSPGVWDFTGDRNCGAYLDLCAELGLHVIARPGPFICAEWDFGGLPDWIVDQGEMDYRSADPRFLRYVDAYFDQIIPIIHSRQSTHGGTVVLVQVENEYAHLKSDEEGRAYMEYLRDGLIRRGIDVPLISCEGGVVGAIEGANFWSGADGHYRKLREKQPDTPKIVTEFWTGWFEKWGGAKADHKTPDMLEARMMEAIRAGFTGMTHYMFCGGTNFGDEGGRTVGGDDVFMVTSYDYDAPLSEYLGFTPKYGVVKRMGGFIQTTADFLLESEASETDVRVNGKASVRMRRHGDTSMYFVEQHGKERGEVYFTGENGSTYMATAKPGQIVPVTVDLPILPGWKLSYNSFFGGFHDINGTSTLIVFADGGQRSRLRIEAPGDLSVEAPASVQVNQERNRLAEMDLCHFDHPQSFYLSCGTDALHIIVLSTSVMDRTWWDLSGDPVLYIGADGFEPVEEGIGIWYRPGPNSALLRWGGANETKPEHVVEQGHGQSQRQGSQGQGQEQQQQGQEQGHGVQQRLGQRQEQGQRQGANAYTLKQQAVHPKLPEWGHWEVKQELPSATGGYGADELAEESVTNAPSGIRGRGSVWYTARLHSPEANSTTLVLPDTQDPVRIYVNGQEAGLLKSSFGGAMTIRLNAGDNELSLLSQHMGRFNFSFYLGEPKGVHGPVFWNGIAEDFRSGWSTEDGRVIHLDQVNLGIAEGEIIRKSFRTDGNDAFRLVGSVSERVSVNGRNIDMGPYRNWYRIASLDLTPHLVDGDNVIEMAYASSPLARLDLLGYRNDRMIEGWKQRAVTMPDSGENLAWSRAGNRDASASGPAWYRARFTNPAIPEGVRVKLKLRLTGLSKGSFWINGQPMGRYWAIGPQEDYKVPLSVLREQNEILIFDEKGRSPEHITWEWEDMCQVFVLHNRHAEAARSAEWVPVRHR